jgi:hypothetical protein
MFVSDRLIAGITVGLRSSVYGIGGIPVHPEALRNWTVRARPTEVNASTGRRPRKRPSCIRAFTAWLTLSCGQAVNADYIAATTVSWGYHANTVFPDFATRFRSTATRLGFTIKETERQWATAREALRRRRGDTSAAGSLLF